MNVENRKLFRNKDARSRLASMGGIMGSSPELLGTVQKFQEAGPVAPSTFLVQLPGLVGGNEFLQLTAAELQLLNEKQPGLMTSEGVMIQEATPEILSNLNPAQVNTTDNPNIKRMFADLGVELSQEQAPIEAEGPGIIDRFKSMFTMEESPFLFSDTTGVSRDGRSNAEILAEAQALIAPESQVDTSITLPEQPPTTTNESIFSSIGDTMRSNPLRDAIATGRETMAETQKQRGLQELFSETLANQQQAMPGGSPSLLGPGSRESLKNYLTPESMQKAEKIQVGNMPYLYDRTSGTAYRVDGAPITSTEQASVDKILTSDQSIEMLQAPIDASQLVLNEKIKKQEELVFNIDPNKTTFEQREAERQKLKDLKNLPALTEADVFPAETLSTQGATPQEFRAKEAALVESQGGLNSMRLEDSKEQRDQIDASKKAKAKAAAKDKAQKAADSTTKMSEQGPNFVFDPEKIKKEIDEGGSGSNSIIGDATGTNQDLSPKDSVKAFQAMYKEMLGMDDEDKEKEKWHQMAMIGFAIAAGQDPNALSNIAGGLLEGTKMAKKDRARKQDRDDKITMMAIQSAEADRRDRMAEERAIRAEGRKTTTAEGVATTSYERARITAKELAAANIKKEIAKSQSSGQKMSPLEPFSDQVAILGKELLASGQVTDLSVALQLAADAYKPYYVGQSTVNTTGSKLTDEDQVKKLKDAGRSDLEIRQMLIDAGKDPTKFGL